MDGLLEVFLLLAVAVVILLLWSVIPHLESSIGSWRVRLLLRRLPASHYTAFHNLTLGAGRSGERSMVRVDHLLVSPYGIFVIAARHRSGAIMGAEGDTHWSRVFLRRRQKFRNPLQSLRSQLSALMKLLDLDASCFHALVVFSGHASFRTPMPACVTLMGGLLPFIHVRTQELLGFERAERVAALLASTRPAPGVPAAAAQLQLLRQTQGSRFGARQAVLGLALMGALLVAAFGLADRLTDMPGQFPVREAASGPGPFIEGAPAPRIALPGVASKRTETEPARKFTPSSVVAGHSTADTPARTVDHPAMAQQGAANQSPGRELSLMCAYSAESRRCACYDVRGRKAEMEYSRCKALADRNPGGYVP